MCLYLDSTRVWLWIIYMKTHWTSQVSTIEVVVPALNAAIFALLLSQWSFSGHPLLLQLTAPPPPPPPPLPTNPPPLFSSTSNPSSTAKPLFRSSPSFPTLFPITISILTITTTPLRGLKSGVSLRSPPMGRLLRRCRIPIIGSLWWWRAPPLLLH